MDNCRRRSLVGSGAMGLLISDTLQSSCGCASLDVPTARKLSSLLLYGFDDLVDLVLVAVAVNDFAADAKGFIRRGGRGAIAVEAFVVPPNGNATPRGLRQYCCVGAKSMSSSQHSESLSSSCLHSVVAGFARLEP